MGATFAYFTATSTTAGDAPSTSVNTTEVKGATITFAGEEERFELLSYPGGIGVYGAKASIAKTNEDDVSHEYQATFNLKIEYINKTQTDLEWELYMVEEANKVELNAEETTICKLIEKKDDASGETRFWYSDIATEGENEATDKGCSASAITSKLAGMGSTKIASGKLLHYEEERDQSNDGKRTITKDTATDETGEYNKDDGELSKRVINTKDKKAKYYYLVVKYPNENKPQTNDQNKLIQVNLSLDGKPAATLYEEQ